MPVADWTHICTKCNLLWKDAGARRCVRCGDQSNTWHRENLLSNRGVWNLKMPFNDRMEALSRAEYFDEERQNRLDRFEQLLNDRPAKEPGR